MRFTLATLVASTAVTVLAQQKPQDLTGLLNGNSNLTEYTTLLTSYRDLYANLSFQQDVTVLCPSNDAFQKIPYSTLGPAFTANDSGVIRSVLQYHVLPGLHPASSFNGSFLFESSWLENSTYTNVTGGQVVGGVQQAGNVNVFTSGLGSRSTLTTPDLKFSGGIVHVIDTFLQPPVNIINTAPQFNLTAFGGAITNASLSDQLNIAPDLTIFAPNNEAFHALGSSLSTMSTAELANVLNYHIVNGSHSVGYSSNLTNGTQLQTRQGGKLTFTFASNSLFVNSARVLQQDILLSNGVLHVLDNILDYNATKAQPQPALPTQPAVLSGSTLSGNVVPYTEDLPSSVSSFSTSDPTPGASSFGVSDIGSSPTTTSTAGSASSTAKTTKKAAGNRVEAQGSSIGIVFGALLWVFGAL